MAAIQHLTIEGKRFVVVEEAQYEKLCARAGKSIPTNDDDLPRLPRPDRNGRFPAIAYARISLARDIIRDRRAAGLTQQELARLSGTRQETISRIESAKYPASPKLVDRIDRALKTAIKKRTR